MGKNYTDEELAESSNKLKNFCEAEGIEGEIRIRGVALDKVKKFAKISLSSKVDPLSEKHRWRDAERKTEQGCDAGSEKKTTNHIRCFNRKVRGSQVVRPLE